MLFIAVRLAKHKTDAEDDFVGRVEHLISSLS
jgi:hypothetical protein